jgi:hypothetical protein
MVRRVTELRAVEMRVTAESRVLKAPVASAELRSVDLHVADEARPLKMDVAADEPRILEGGNRHLRTIVGLQAT